MLSCAEAEMARNSGESVEGLLTGMRHRLTDMLSHLQSRLLHGHDDSSSSKAIRAVDTLLVHHAAERGRLVDLRVQVRKQFATIGYWTASVQRRSAGGEQGALLLPADTWRDDSTLGMS